MKQQIGSIFRQDCCLHTRDRNQAQHCRRKLRAAMLDSLQYFGSHSSDESD
jgi:hypothetical protein